MRMFSCKFFRICPIIFLSTVTKNKIKMWMKKVIRFQITEVQHQGVA